ncbi:MULTISPECIES: hypothetical protein [Haloferax]|uniref:Uncharacterized protein n=1 Tax=Haloferax marinum TaxID=2666143 RepID=A0A6A8GBX3_9EURY|nr:MULTISPECIES: hypothetical protein [Haloferax]KAB1191170.1 hypothetical protein Hfx1150_15945 [Haloferax sp. CBA1150]MRW98058.1 hypothetical protein [Haloferax marinum]
MREPDTCAAIVVGESLTEGVGIFEFDAEVVILQGEELNIWVGEEHFISDPEGSVQRGQFLLVTQSSTGSIARIVEVNSPSKPDGDHPIELEHEFRWDAEGVTTEPVVEFCSQDDVKAEEDSQIQLSERAKVVRYVRPTNR